MKLPLDLEFSLSARQWRRANPDKIVRALPMTDLTIHKVLEISTAHLMPPTLTGWLPAQTDRPSTIVPHEYGWFVQAHYLLDQITAEEIQIPADLEECCRLAQDNGCLWVMFDQDGARLEQLTDYQEAYE